MESILGSIDFPCAPRDRRRRSSHPAFRPQAATRSLEMNQLTGQTRPQPHVIHVNAVQPLVALRGCPFTRYSYLFQKKIQMLRRTLVALAATVALGCFPIATNAFAHGGSHGHSWRAEAVIAVLHAAAIGTSAVVTATTDVTTATTDAATVTAPVV